MVAGTGEPEAAQERESRRRRRRGKAGAVQKRESRGGAARRGAVEGKKIKASTFLCKPFSILHIAGEPFNGHAENAGKYDKFIIGYKAQAGFYAADRLAPYAKTGHLEFGGKCVLREALCGLGGFYRRRYWPCPRMYKSSNLFTSLYLTIAFFTLNLVIKIYKA